MAVFQLGDPCPESGLLGCAGIDGVVTLVCALGKWEAFDRCAPEERCDTRLGQTQGQCFPLVDECRAARPGDQVCQGANRVTCGPDRISVDPASCPGALTCVVNAEQAECVCPSGYQLVEPDQCADILDCAVDNGGCDLNPMATCNEVVGGPNSCTCPPGYDGSGRGDNGCTDVDECAAGVSAACGPGATTCTNSAGSFSCTCDGDHVLLASMQGCRFRTWGTPVLVDSDDSGSAKTPQAAVDAVGDVIVVWETPSGIWSNNYDIEFGWRNATPIGGDGSNDAFGPVVAIDRSGNAMAVWQDYNGTRYDLWANRYLYGIGWRGSELIEHDDTGSANYPALVIDSRARSVAVWSQFDGTRSNIVSNSHDFDASWTTGAPIETDNAGSAYYPSLSIDDANNIIAVWQQSNGSRYDIWSNRYRDGVGWGTATMIETLSGTAFYPKVAASSDGSAVAVWQQSDGTYDNIWANRYGVGVGWGSAILVEITNAGSASNPRVSLDATGNAIVVWQQSDGSRESIWTNRFAADIGWGDAALLEHDDAASATNPQIATDRDGNAVAVWQQSDGTRTNIWASRYSSKAGWSEPVLVENDNVGDAASPTVTVDRFGVATAVWHQSDGTRTNIWANRLE